MRAEKSSGSLSLNSLPALEVALCFKGSRSISACGGWWLVVGAFLARQANAFLIPILGTLQATAAADTYRTSSHTWNEISLNDGAVVGAVA